MQGYKYIAIDGNNLFWRAVCSCIKHKIQLQDETGDIHDIYSNVVRDFLDRINELKSQYLYDNGITYILFDNPNTMINIRKIIDEEYKSPRASKILPPAFYNTLKILKELLLYYSDNMYLCYSQAMEADDLVKPLLESLEINNVNRVLMISADLDWARSIDSNVDWFNYKKVYTRGVFEQEFKFPAYKNNLILYKTFRGDNSDNIPSGLPNIPEELLLYIIKESKVFDDCVSFRQYLKKLQSFEHIPEHWKIKIKDNEERLIINFQLVNFVDIDESIENMLYKCKLSVSSLKSWFDLLRLQYEARMLSKNDCFFSKQKYKRIKRV